MITALSSDVRRGKSREEKRRDSERNENEFYRVKLGWKASRQHISQFGHDTLMTAVVASQAVTHIVKYGL